MESISRRKFFQELLPTKFSEHQKNEQSVTNPQDQPENTSTAEQEQPSQTPDNQETAKKITVNRRDFMKFLHIASLTLGSVTALTRSHTTEILDVFFKQKK